MASGRVLLVEDDGFTRRTVSETLQRQGYQVEALESAEEALHVFARDPFDAVVSDVVLPGMDGLEMIRRLREVDPTLACVVMTSRQDQETAVQALEVGVRQFLNKPFSSTQLAEKLSDALDERKQAIATRLMLGDLLHTRSRLEERLQKQHHLLVQTRMYLHQLLDAAPFAVLSTNHEDKIVTFNGTAERLYGYDSQEVLGRPLSFLFGEEPPPSSQGRRTHIHREGGDIPVLVWQREIRDLDGSPLGRLFFVEDLSQREQLEEQLLYAERLSMLGQLAPRIAHEFKTPLQLISGYVQLTLEELPSIDKEQIQSYLEFVQPAIDQMLQLVQQIAHLGRPTDSRQEALDLAEEMDRVLAPLRQLGAVKNCRLECRYERPLPRVLGDPAQIEQVFRNLIVNAAQAMEESRERAVYIAIRSLESPARVEVTVRDTGPGIPPELQERIFEPFFTTKPEGKGTGLGLPIVKTIMERHGGHVRVESESGTGACFRLLFPALSAASDGESTPVPPS